MMLVHIGQGDVAEKIHNAWLTTLEAGVHTGDIFHEKVSELKVGTDAFADAVIERLGQRPARFTPVEYAGGTPVSVAGRISVTHPAVKTLLGVDVFLHWRGAPNALGPQLEALNGDGLKLTMISNRGVQVLSVLMRVGNAGLDFVKTEHLYAFDGVSGFSPGQGQ